MDSVKSFSSVESNSKEGNVQAGPARGRKLTCDEKNKILSEKIKKMRTEIAAWRKRMIEKENAKKPLAPRILTQNERMKLAAEAKGKEANSITRNDTHGATLKEGSFKDELYPNDKNNS